MGRRNYVQTYDLTLKDGRTVKRHRAFWYDAAGHKHGTRCPHIASRPTPYWGGWSNV